MKAPTLKSHTGAAVGKVTIEAFRRGFKALGDRGNPDSDERVVHDPFEWLRVEPIEAPVWVPPDVVFWARLLLAVRPVIIRIGWDIRIVGIFLLVRLLDSPP